MRQVKGLLFLDYVRMIRSHKNVEWETFFDPADIAYLVDRIDVTGWYPMATFERFGNAILKFVAGNQLLNVQLWGRFSASQLHAANPMLLAAGDPVESINRFRVLRQTFFDFDALDIPLLHDGAAQIVIRYHMGAVAEEAACYQTLGFFEGLLELAGAKRIDARFRQRSWDGDQQTRLDLTWTLPEDR
ncbi:MAG TPA: hypothetical protein VGC41_24290 [Kofleriaceae bacterium]